MVNRRIVQIFTALIYNINFKGFMQGKIFKGNTKAVCVPGLNCYSCPGAIASCPIGVLQSSITNADRSFPFYIIGTLLLFGILFGRLVCSFLCFFGLIQDLLYKIPTPKIIKSKFTRKLSYLKYMILAVFVIILPIYLFNVNGVGTPTFCKYICPVGTLEAGIPLVLANKELQSVIGALFTWKIIILVIIIFLSIIIYRPFCRFLCPLGAFYSFFNKYAIFGIKIDENKCNDCCNCTSNCKIDVKYVNDRECIRCGECRGKCNLSALGVVKIKQKHCN